MKAITVEPKKPGTATLVDIPEPGLHEGSVLVQAIAVGVCGTDVEIAEGKYGWAPPGQQRLILGHESLGRVIDPGPSSGLKKGDLVVGIVRRPDPVPCPNCAVGEWDMCRNGLYTERGIKEINGFMSEYWRIEPEYAIKVGLIGRRSFWEPKTALITGAGPVGLLAALFAKLYGLEVHVLDRIEGGAKADLVRELGGVYHSCNVKDLDFEPDTIIECTGVGQVISESIQKIGANGIVCLAGIGHGGATRALNLADVASTAVLRNNVIVGSVNANKRHWYRASQNLARADRKWLAKLITRVEKPENFMQALKRTPDDIKVVIQFSEI
jgi:threonine dehydrogenase-like Zn-dependent dehydrogenase